MNATSLTIGQLAKAAGVSVETVRYYQRRQLLPQPVKPRNGYRRYDGSAVRRLRFIKKAQQLGFSLQEIDQLLQMSGAGCCRQSQRLAQQKVALIRQKIAALTAIQRGLETLIQRCDEATVNDRCPLIDQLLAAD